MSVLGLKQQIEGHITFSKQDVFSHLKDTIPKAGSQNAGASPEGAITLPASSDIGGVEPLPAITHGTDNAILALPECTSYDGAPPAEAATPSTKTNPPGASGQN